MRRVGKYCRMNEVQPVLIVLVVLVKLASSRNNMLPHMELNTALTCRLIAGLTREQKALCHEAPDTTAVAFEGLQLAVKECQHQFRWHRWNCSSLLARSANPHASAIMRRGFRETSFLYALSAAGVAHAVARACAQGRLLACDCDTVGYRARPRARPGQARPSKWEWSGCSHNLAYGIQFSKRFLDVREQVDDLQSKINVHNNNAGRVIKKVSHHLCNMCCTRLKQFGSLLKQIGNYQKYSDDQENEVECQPIVTLSTHVTEKGSIPYHINKFKEETIILIKKEKEDCIEENKNRKLKLPRKNKTKAICDKKPRKITKRTTNKSFPCDICNKKYGRSDHLKLHKMSHTNDTPYACDVCKKKFKRKDHLQNHMKTHTSNKPHKCDICSKTFLKGSNLRAHKLIHTREKPFSCDVCNKTFTRKSHLTGHQRTHSGDKPYPCPRCNQTFRRSDHLRSHQKVHQHDDDIFHCDYCQEVFIFKRHLKVHILKTHFRR